MPSDQRKVPEFIDVGIAKSKPQPALSRFEA